MNSAHALRALILSACLSVWAGWSTADVGPIPTTLKGVRVPEVPGLLDGPSPIVVDKAKAIALGKALFWDMNVGSDGMACASCHFRAGADGRTANQWAAGGHSQSGNKFETGTDGLVRGPNQALRMADFPFFQTNEPLKEADVVGIARYTDDVVGSAGTFGGTFKSVDYMVDMNDGCERSPDVTHQLGGIGTRRVIARNAPTVINAVFNHRVLWDGRASNVFNGSSAWGPRDPKAGVWVRQADGSLTKERLNLINASLASQAMTAPLNDIEMGCKGRSMADIGRKLLYRDALENQQVHVQDSVLGSLSRAKTTPGQPGLSTSYIALVQQAFAPRFWAYNKRGPFGKPNTGVGGVMSLAYSQTEANFGMFFGLALQLYQSTLVSDDSPFDRSARDANNLPTDLTPSQLRGLQVFRTAHCALCHIGPNFTSAAIDVNASLVSSRPWAFGDKAFRNTTSTNVVTRQAGNKGIGIVDTGFAATGVGKDEWDAGLAGKDGMGMDIALASQYLQLLAGNTTAVKDARVMNTRPCDMQFALALNQSRLHPSIFTQVQGVMPQAQPNAGCLNTAYAFQPTPVAAATELASPANKRMLALTDAAFKIPTLRNVELTGPFMHNGSMATLEHVIEFYARGGNFEGASKQFGTVFPQPDLQLSSQARADLLEFLKSLTDERVRYAKAPFDHPELKVPHGHVGNRSRVSGGNALSAALAQDQWLTIPAVGSAGQSTPILPFAAYLPD
jgi:cytochrome c peroxidase